MAQVVLRYWAGAKAAAGVESTTRSAATVDAALAAAGAESERLAEVLRRSTFLIDGRVLRQDERRRPLESDVTVEVLPPFAGG